MSTIMPEYKKTYTNKYADAILESFTTISSAAVKDSKKTNTFDAEVIEIIDANINEYRIEYLNQKLKAYSLSSTTMYSVGDKVIVQMLDGTMDGMLTILGARNPYVGLYTPTELSNDFLKMGESVFGVNGGAPIDICSYRTIPRNTEIVPLDRKFKDTLFNNYLTKYRTFCFTIDVKTEIEDPIQRMNGNYGLILELPFIKTTEDGKKENSNYIEQYIFDINNMTGNPYQFDIWTKQTIYIKFADNLVYDTTRNPRMTVFSEGFINDDKHTDYDIHIRNVEFYPVDEIPAETLAGYYLTLTATNGNFFLNTEDSSGFKEAKTITPTLRVNGNNTSIDNCDCFWFVEDATINYSSNYYYKDGGPGWRCLNEKVTITNSDGAKSDDWVKDKRTLEVSIDDVATTLRYKCIILYNKTLISQTIELENLSSPIKIDVYKVKDIVIKNTGYAHIGVDVKYIGENKPSSSDLVYSWTRYGAINQLLNDTSSAPFYEILEEDIYSYATEEVEVGNNGTENKTVHKYHTEIRYPASMITDGLNHLICTVYLADGDSKKLLGSGRVDIATVDNANFFLTIIGGDKLFKYDADGDSPAAANYDGPVSSRINSYEPVSFKISKKDGSELTDDEYAYCIATWSIPKARNSETNEPGTTMLNIDIDALTAEQGFEKSETETHYLLKGNGRTNIPYKIFEKFDKNKYNNSIGLEVEVNRDGDVVRDVANFTFIKEGEAGTNGTKYAVLLKHKSTGYDESFCYDVTTDDGVNHKLQLIYVGDKEGWYYKTNSASPALPFSNTTFDVEVYKDGELITDSSQYKIPVWNFFDQEGMKNENEKLFEFSGMTLKHTDVKWDVDAFIPVYVVQAKVVVTNTSTTEKDQIIYAEYPLEITYVQSESASGNAPTMVGGYTSVIYSTDSTNPQYNSVTPFKMIDGLSQAERESEDFEYTWEVGPDSDNLKLIDADAEKGETSTGNVRRVRPTEKFDNGVVRNYVRVALGLDEEIKTGIQGEIEHIDAEVAELQTELDAWNTIKDGLDAAAYTHAQAATAPYYPYLASNWTLEHSQVFSKRELAYRQLEQARSAMIEYYEIFKRCEESGVRFDENQYNYENKNTIFTGYINKSVVKIYNLISKQTLEELPPIFMTTENEDGSVSLNPEFILSPTEQEVLYLYSTDMTPQDVERVLQIAYTYDQSIVSYRRYYNELTEKVINEQGKEDYKLQGDLDSLQNIYRQYKAYSSHRKFTDLAKLVSPILDAEGNEVKPYASLVNNVQAIVNNYFVASETNYPDSIKETWSVGQFRDNILKTIHTYVDKVYTTVENFYDGLSVAETIPQTHVMLQLDRNIEELTRQIEELNYEKNKLQKGLTLGESAKIVHIRPVIFKNNTYEFSYLNDWDGGKLYTGENDEYLIAPIVGAGKKEDDNTFTGLTMGVKKLENGSNEIGLFGHSKGRRSLFIDAETGKAEFGLQGNGQIIIDPNADEENQGVIRSGGYVAPKVDNNGNVTEPGEGMEINFSKPSITYGSGDFMVDEVGHMTAKGGGSIAGWEIGDTALEAKDDKGKTLICMDSTIPAVYAKDHKELISTKEGFYLGPDGLSIDSTLRAQDGVIYLGKVDGKRRWTVGGTNDGGNSYIAYGAMESFASDPVKDTIYLGTDGIRVGTKFQVEGLTGVTEIGNLKGKHWTIDGSDSLGESYIFYGAEAATPMLNSYTQSVYLGTDGISLGKDKFWVTDRGRLTAKEGNIAGWEFDANKLMSSGDADDTRIKIRASGAIEGGYFDANDKLDTTQDYWKINKDGDAYFGKIDARGKITATSGRFGNVIINGDGSINNGNGFKVDANGNLTAVNAKFTNGDFQGKISANSGDIGGWVIEQTYLKGGNLKLNADGSIEGPGWSVSSTGNALFNKIICKGNNGYSKLEWGDKFWVDTDGTLHATGGIFEGSITATSGKIGNFEISGGSLISPNLNIGKYTQDGSNYSLIRGDGFSFSTSGLLSCSGLSVQNASSVFGTEAIFNQKVSFNKEEDAISVGGKLGKTVTYVNVFTDGNIEPNLTGNGYVIKGCNYKTLKFVNGILISDSSN